MKVYNYTKIKKREKRIYSIMNTNFSSEGIAANVISTSAAMLSIFSIFGLTFCALTHKFWYNPIYIAYGPEIGYFYLIFVFIPIGLGILLNKFKIQNYTALDYLKIYFYPKIPLRQDGKKLKMEKIEINGFVERI